MKRIQFMQLLSIAVLFFAFATACDKSDDPGGDFPSAGTVKDADGNVYNTVKIGDQVWMAENLKTTKYNDGTPIINITDNAKWDDQQIGACCYYDNQESNKNIYGLLYNWYSIESNKLAPQGWHVATKSDWDKLLAYISAHFEPQSSIAKSLASKDYWKTSSEIDAIGNNLIINDSFGFSALPGGYRKADGSFKDIEKGGYWWTTEKTAEFTVWLRNLSYDKSILGRSGFDPYCGLSIRLVRD